MLLQITISKKCEQCKGACWVPDNQLKTQENAKKRFGVIPNACVNGGAGNLVHCPAARKLM